MIIRHATTQEFLSHRNFDISHGIKVSYRHFVREIFSHRAEHGVAHRQHSRSRIRVIDGKPHVMHRGELHEITGDLVTLESGRQFVADLRIKSKYLTSAIGGAATKEAPDPFDEPICDKYATAGVDIGCGC